MIKVTSAARVHIEKIIERNSNALGFRLGVKETGCSGLMYIPEVALELKSDDLLFEVDGLKVYIPEASVAYLNGTEIDLATKTLGQQQLVFNNPNADSLCGCGESFNLKKKDDE